jgi:hypothetical protein
MGLPDRADVRDADDWWGTLSNEKRVSTHRWLSGKGKLPPPSQPEVLFGFDDDGAIVEVEAES